MAGHISYLLAGSILLHCISLIQAGSCWYGIGPKNTCTDMISMKMSRKECCEADPKGEKFYSDDESSLGSLDLRFLLATHKCGMACQDGCDTFKSRCKDKEICKMKNGIPRCLCDPNCAMHSLSKRGPICGNDGRTYRSHCQLLRQNCRKNKDVEVNYFGPCRVSTCDGVVCAKAGEKCTTDQYNTAVCVPVSYYHCNLNLKSDDAICATNDETFLSICHMTQYNIEKGLNLRVQYHSKCTDEMSCDADTSCKTCLFDQLSGSHVCLTEGCPSCESISDSAPKVCGEDGITYENECALRRHACLTKTNLSVKHIDRCGASDEDILWTNEQRLRSTDGNMDDVFSSLIHNGNLS